jgi:osomolarity two-component system response regulator SKN7
MYVLLPRPKRFEGSVLTPNNKAWEFKHPEFRADRKDNLDNIRRKAPAPRKTAQQEDAFSASQQIMVLNDSLTATQRDLQTLREQYSELEKTNKMLVTEVLSLQKLVHAQSRASTELLNHLTNLEERRRSHRTSAQPAGTGFASMGFLPDGTDDPSPELRRARDILSSMNTDLQGDKEMERLSAYNQNGSTPGSAATSGAMFPNTPAAVGMPMMHDAVSDPRQLVYPGGQPAEMDPFHADQMHNMQYSRPMNPPTLHAEAPPQMAPQIKVPTSTLWQGKKPHVLLVDDDRTCIRIGHKILTNLECTVDTAVSSRAVSGL